MPLSDFTTPAIVDLEVISAHFAALLTRVIIQKGP